MTLNENLRNTFLRACACARIIAIFAALNIVVVRPLSAVESEPSLELRATPTEIYEGESSRLTLSATNVKLDAPPKFENLERDFIVKYLGESNRTSVRITNSARVEDRAVDYNYLISPRRAGSFAIDPPEINVGNAPLSCPSVTLTVREETKTDLVLLEANVNPSESVYPLVPFEASVDVYVKAAPGKYGEYDPLALVVHNLDAPQLNIPWLDANFFNDAMLASPLDDWLSKLSSNDAGFYLNNYRKAENIFDFSFSLFGEPSRKSYFSPKPTKVERDDAEGNRVVYWKYSFTRKMRANAPGNYAFAPSSLKGNFLDFSDLEKPLSRSIYLATKPVEITVKEIPLENAPEDYVGIYGKISQKAAFSSTEASVGDALTLSLEFSGYGSFTSAVAPNLSELEGVKGIFKVYPASERSLDSGVAFDYKLRPLKPGKQLFPEIETSFFNVETGQFEATRSQPTTIDVKEGVVGVEDSSADAETQGKDRPENNGENDKPSLQGRDFRQLASVVALGFLCLVFFVALCLVFRAALRYNARRIAASNRRILDSARIRLEEGLSRIESAPGEGFAQVRLAFLQLVGRRLSHAPDSYTDAEIVDFIRAEFSKEIAKDPEAAKTTAQLADFLNLSEKIRFGGKTSLDPNFKSEIRVLFDRWIKMLVARSRKLSALART